MALNLKKFAKAAEPAKKKETTPVLEIADTKENRQALSTIVEQKKVEKNAEALRKQAEVTIRPLADVLRRKHCQDEGKFCSSIKVKCGETGPVTYSNQNRYTADSLDKEDELRSIFGDQYEKCFSTDTTVSLTDKGLKEAEKGDLLERLVLACGGEEKFAELFSVEQKIKPTEFLHEQKILDDKIGDMVRKANEAGLVRQATGSFSI